MVGFQETLSVFCVIDIKIPEKFNVPCTANTYGLKQINQIQNIVKYNFRKQRFAENLKLWRNQVRKNIEQDHQV